MCASLTVIISLYTIYIYYIIQRHVHYWRAPPFPLYTDARFPAKTSRPAGGLAGKKSTNIHPPPMAWGSGGVGGQLNSLPVLPVSETAGVPFDNYYSIPVTSDIGGPAAVCSPIVVFEYTDDDKSATEIRSYKYYIARCILYIIVAPENV